MATRNSKKNEPVLIVKSAKLGGLDYLHISLIILVFILVALAFSLSSYKQPTSTGPCPGGPASMCITTAPHSNSTQALAAAESIVASYSNVNSSLSLISFYSLMNKANVSYVPSASEWLVTVPYINPLANNQTFYYSLLIYDSNLTLAHTFIATIPPYSLSYDKTVSLGVISLYNGAECTTTKPFPVYTFVDIYAPGAMPELFRSINISNRFSSTINMSYKFIFTGYAAKYYGSGISSTQQPAENLFCATKQKKLFRAYLSNFSQIFVGNPLANTTLASIAVASGLNITQFNACLLTSPGVLQAQAVLSSFYDVKTTPSYVLGCKYYTIPQTFFAAYNYTLTH